MSRPGISGWNTKWVRFVKFNAVLIPYLETLALADVHDHFLNLATFVERRSVHQLPVVEDGLREGLTGGRATEVSVEAEGFHDREVGLDREHGSSWALFFREDLATTPVEHRVDTTNGVLRALDFDEIDGLLETWGGEQAGSIGGTTAGWDDLSSTTVDSVSVELNVQLASPKVMNYYPAYRDINNVHADTAHVLLSAYTFLGRPLEGSNARVLDFVEVLHTLGDINQQVRASGVGAKTPNLAGIGNVPAILVGENTSAGLEVVTRVNLAIFDGQAELLIYRLGLDIETVVLVLRLGEGNNRGLGLDSLTVTDDGIGLLERNTGVVFLKILYLLSV